MRKGLPSPTPGAADVAKLTTGIGTALVSLWFPPAAFAGPILQFAIDKFVERPKKMLLDAMEKGEIAALTYDKAAEFIPMGYRFMEAAKQGEYEHTLKVLAAFIAGELGQETPEASNFAGMARRLQSISIEELRLLSLIPTIPGIGERPIHNRWFKPSDLFHADTKLGEGALDEATVYKCVAELASRGFLVSVPVTVMQDIKGCYLTSDSLWDLLAKAGGALPPGG